MENIIKKAIEGGYDKKYIPVIGIDFPRHHTTVTTILMDRDFWQALGKACGWENNTVLLFDDIELSTRGCELLGGNLKYPYNEGGSVSYHIDTCKYYALRFYEINLTEGWEKAVEYLQNLIEQK